MGVAAVLLSSSLSMLESLKGLGFIGRLAYMLGLSLWVVICGPTAPIEVEELPVSIFPIYLSTVMSVVGKTMGNIMAFVLGRHLLKPMVSRMLMRGGADRGRFPGFVFPIYLSVSRWQDDAHPPAVGARQRPIQTMSILRAAPLPTPFKIYGLCLFPSELVPLPHYMCIALVFNTCWSVVWSLAGSTANNLHDVISGQGAARTRRSSQRSRPSSASLAPSPPLRASPRRSCSRPAASTSRRRPPRRLLLGCRSTATME